jgi:N-acetylmuramoyl-L-alanine amidase
MKILTSGFFTLFLIVMILSCNQKKTPLEGKTICIDPGHGGTAQTDSYRVGPTGEREEWINLRVALQLAELLEKGNANVILTREKDTAISLKNRAELAINNHADLFISIHHNATADSSVNFPIIYFHGNASENKASVQFGKILSKKLQEEFYNKHVPVSLVSDFTIFPSSGTSVLRNSYGIPGIIGEASFFTNPQEEKLLKNASHNKKEAQAYFDAIVEFFSHPQPVILPVYSKIKLPALTVFQEADRMKPEALFWKENFEKGTRLASSPHPDSLKKAEELLYQSIKAFPDSWISRDAHIQLSKILYKTNQKSTADTIYIRTNEFYIKTEK